MQTLTWLPKSGSTYRLQARQRVPAPLDIVFPFFADAENLSLLTPDTLHFRIETPTPIRMVEGAIIDYRLRLRGVPFRWRSRITQWDPPHAFVDEQVRGPYSFWHHEHRFEPDGTGTLITDTVDYRVPGGAVVHRWLVEPQLRRIFGFRGDYIAQRFGTGQGSWPGTAAVTATQP